MRKLALLCTFALMLTLLAACGDTSGNVTSNNPNTVKLDGNNFIPTLISIKKGSTITFIDESSNGGLHILVIGQNGQQESENNAPDFGGIAGQRIDVGETWTTPPWNTVGTYHIACTVHPLMNLTVTVTG